MAKASDEESRRKAEEEKARRRARESRERELAERRREERSREEEEESPADVPEEAPQSGNTPAVISDDRQNMEERPESEVKKKGLLSDADSSAFGSLVPLSGSMEEKSKPGCSFTDVYI